VSSQTVVDIADLLGGIWWPLVALVIALIFRTPFRALLRREDVEIKGPGGVSVSAKGREAAATALSPGVDLEDDARVRSLERTTAEKGVEVAAQGVEALGRPPQILWVDDRPSNNRYEVAALTSLGMHVQLSTSTADALDRVSASQSVRPNHLRHGEAS
jgi:hypothetical protein